MEKVVERKNLKQVTDRGVIEKLVDDVIANNPIQVTQYKATPEEKKEKLIGYFVGQIMKKSQGKANPKKDNELLIEKLDT